jgi:hypothetical protein
MRERAREMRGKERKRLTFGDELIQRHEVGLVLAARTDGFGSNRNRRRAERCWHGRVLGMQSARAAMRDEVTQEGLLLQKEEVRSMARKRDTSAGCKLHACLDE